MGRTSCCECCSLLLECRSSKHRIIWWSSPLSWNIGFLSYRSKKFPGEQGISLGEGLSVMLNGSKGRVGYVLQTLEAEQNAQFLSSQGTVAFPFEIEFSVW